MAKQTINIGTTANDGTGNTLRAAMNICNDNFTEVYGFVQYKYTDTVLTSPPTIAEINAITGTDENNAIFGNLYIIADSSGACYIVTYAAYEVYIFPGTKLTI